MRKIVKLVLACAVLTLALIATLACAVLMLALIATPAAAATPPAKHPQECSMIADMVLVALVHERQAVAAEKRVPLLDEIYAELLNGPRADAWTAWPDVILQWVQRPELSGHPAHEVAAAVGRMCHARQGNVGAVLGEGV